MSNSYLIKVIISVYYVAPLYLQPVQVQKIYGDSRLTTAGWGILLLASKFLCVMFLF
ncbi:hypothetical protein D3C73_1509550 [compost metagenome]